MNPLKRYLVIPAVAAAVTAGALAYRNFSNRDVDVPPSIQVPLVEQPYFNPSYINVRNLPVLIMRPPDKSADAADDTSGYQPDRGSLFMIANPEEPDPNSIDEIVKMCGILVF